MGIILLGHPFGLVEEGDLWDDLGEVVVMGERRSMQDWAGLDRTGLVQRKQPRRRISYVADLDSEF